MGVAFQIQDVVAFQFFTLNDSDFDSDGERRIG